LDLDEDLGVFLLLDLDLPLLGVFFYLGFALAFAVFLPEAATVVFFLAVHDLDFDLDYDLEAFPLFALVVDFDLDFLPFDVEAFFYYPFFWVDLELLL
jgi:hypothetical protein